MKDALKIRLGEIRIQTKNEFVKNQVLSFKAELSKFQISADQVSAWERLCGWLYESVLATGSEFDTIGCFFEFSPPFKSERSDLMLVSEKEIIVVEAKTGISHNLRQAQKQALSYSYDVYNALLVGTSRTVTPLVLQEYRSRKGGGSPKPIVDHAYDSKEVAVIPAEELALCISRMTPPSGAYDLLDTSSWMHRPRASVVSISREMFGNMRSGEVLKSLADNDELDRVINRVGKIIKDARDGSEHRVIAITGRPGSGKTLVGLRIAHQTSFPEILGEGAPPPIYLSGNGPLVDVLQESIARSFLVSKKKYSVIENIETARRFARQQILEVRGVLSTDFRIDSNVIIFDEAQRAWTAKRMRQKKNNQALESQPYEILKKMSDRKWAVVICLVGTGQHINQGEEGMVTWYDAVKKLRSKSVDVANSSNWQISIPRGEQFDGEFVNISDDLELSVDMRASSARFNEWVNLLLDNKISEASKCRTDPDLAEFPLFVTQNLHVCIEWLKSNSNLQRGETAGLVASSESGRLSSYGVRVAGAASERFPAVNWYLEKPPNLDSCNSFDFAATEYGCQGLELDRVGVCWSWDLVPKNGEWTPRTLNRSSGRWNLVKNRMKSEFVKNTYRVLLTRSRSGMVIWVPSGDVDDESRSSSEAAEVYQTLISAGCKPL